MGARKCLQAACYDLLCLCNCWSLNQTAGNNGLYNREQILCAVLQFTHQKVLTALCC